MPSLLPLGGTIRLNASAGGAATLVPLAEGGFATVYRIAGGTDVFTLYDDNFSAITGEIPITSDDFLAPQAAALNTGQFVVVWLDNEQQIEATIYNPDGSVATGPVAIASATDPSVGLSAPRVVGNAFGGFTTIWQDNASINGVTGTVFIQSYDGDGNPVGDPITVLPPTVGPTDTATINDFQMAVLGDGTIVVAAQVQIDGVDSIMYSVNGGPLTQLAGGDPSYLYTNPQITPLADGGYVITYDFVNPNLVGTDSPDANWTTGGAVFTSHGTQHDFAIGTTVTTTQNGTFAVDPSVITPLADGGFVVTFEPLTSPLGDGYLVDAQQFDAFGNAVGPVVLVAPEGFLPSVATSADGVVLDTYQFGSGIFLQAYNSAPTPLGPEPQGTSFGLDSVVSANSPGVAPLTTGGFVVVYQDANENAWAQIYDTARDPVGSPFEIAAGATQPVVASQTNGTFIVVWSTGTQIMGALYNNEGDLLGGPFDMSGAPSTLPVLDPAVNALPNGGYEMAYETDLRDGSGSHLVTIQQFDGEGNAVGASVSQTYAPTNPLAPPKIASLEAELFGSVTVIGVGDAIVAAIVTAPPTGNSGAGIAGQAIAVSHANATPTTNTVTVSGSNDGAQRADAQVATLTDGNIVVVWDEAASDAGTWSVMGQVMTPAGAFVGAPFAITTSLPSNSPPSQLALSALPDGGFLVTYDAGNSSLASQRFDPDGNAVSPPVLMSNPGQSAAVTTVLSNGALLLVSNRSSAGVTTISGNTFSVPPIPMNWTGTSGTNLGVAANWDINLPPDSGHVMQFGLSNGGTLTGAATAEAASFTGGGNWQLSDAAVALTGTLSEQSTLAIAGGTLTAGGAATIGASGGASVTESGGAQVSVLSTEVADGTGQTGTLTVSGTGTAWRDTGNNGSGGLTVGQSSGVTPARGQITVTSGATLSGSDTDILGVTAGSQGGLTISNAGTVSDSGLVAGQGGTGDVTIAGAVLSTTGSVVVGQNTGADGTIAVSGSAAAMTVGGALIVGGAGFGILSVQNAGTVTANGADVGQAATGGGGIAVSGSAASLGVTGSLTIGDLGVGGLTVEADATVTTTGGVIIANTTGASNSFAGITGTGASWRIGGGLTVGAAGYGQLAIAQGASVTAASATEAAATGGDGLLSVQGVGSALTLTGGLTVGAQGAGELSILSGATVSAGSVAVGGAGAASSGNVDIEGAASTLLIGAGGALNIGVAAGGGGVLTVGSGAILNFAGTIVEAGHASLNNNGGTIDPDAVEFASSTNAGTGLNEYDLRVGNIGAVQISGGTGTWDSPMLLTGTSPADAANNISGNGDVGQWQLSQNGTLIINANTVDAGQAIVFEDATDTLVIGQQVNGGADGVSGTLPTVVAGAENLLQAGGFQAQIWGYQPGDQILFNNMVVVSDSIVNNNTLDLYGSGDALLGDLTFWNKAGNQPLNLNAMQTAAAQEVSCFAAGTRIATTRGMVPVETVHPGDRVCTVLNGDTAGVIWVGHRRVDCARHPHPEKVWPVRIAAHAFGRGMPATDLLLSPDHAVYVDGVLIPIRLLANGTTVRQEAVDRITYHHIELARHDVLLANGMPAESYLDTGDRARFSDSGGVIALYPDFSARTWESRGCAMLVQTGPILAAVRRRLGSDVARRRVRETHAPGNRR